MAHLRETFPILENFSTGEGEVATLAKAGEAVANKNGIMSFAFKTHDGNYVLPTLTPEGKVPVDFQGAGVSKRASSDGEIAGATTDTVVAEIDLAADKTVGRIKAKLSCFKEAIAYLVQINGATEEIIGHALVGPGQYDGVIDLGEGEIVTGSTGTQKLVLRAKNLNKLSDFLGHVSCLEFAT